MNRTLPFAIALLAACPAVWAQESRAERILADRPGLNVVFDDDGGKVEIFRRGEAARTAEFHGGAVIHEPLVQIIFLGDAWQKPSLLKTKQLLRASIERVAPGEPIRPATLTGERELPASGTLNDLHIQAAIDRAMTSGALSLRDENVIHVVFLAPGLEDKLGSAAAGRDFDSYHSHFHAQDVNVRYVVVPFGGEVSEMGDAAAKSLVRSMINPDGDGWY
jgi:hypothetical protein